MYKDKWFCGYSHLLTQIVAWIHTIVHLVFLLLVLTGCVLYFGFMYHFWEPKHKTSEIFYPLPNNQKPGKLKKYFKSISYLCLYFYSVLYPEAIKREYMMLLAVWFALCGLEHLLGLIAGIILIIGAKQKNPKKLLIWLWMTPFVLLLTGINVLYLVFAVGENHSIIRMIGLFGSYCCLWPVMIRRKELLDPDHQRLEENKSKDQPKLRF